MLLSCRPSHREGQMHSHHAGHLQAIYSAYPSVQLSLSVTPGMYPHLHVGEGKPDDNSRSVVGITHGLAWCAPRFFLLSLTTPQCPPAPTSLGCCSPYVCFDAVYGTPPSTSKSGTCGRRAFPLTGCRYPPYSNSQRAHPFPLVNCVWLVKLYSSSPVRR